MADTIKLDLVTPERRLVTTEVEDLVATAVQGEFGILPGHANYITLLKPGELRYSEAGQTRNVAVSGGFAEVGLEEGIRIMAEAAEFAEEIDVERAQAARERAERRISEYHAQAQEIDIDRAEVALHRAMVRLQVVGKA